MARNVLTQSLLESLAGATSAKIAIDIADGNLTVDRLPDGEQVLASGTLQYVEGQSLPKKSVNTANGQTTLTLKAESTGRPWLRMPWTACNLGTDWHIHLNPKVQSDIAAHSGGGNVKLNLTGMAVTCVSADTGGGNMDVVLPDEAADLSVTATTGAGRIALAIGSHITGCNIIHAKSGAGNVTVQVPSSIAARIYVSNGMGKTTVDPRFNKIDGNTYQSPEYDGASDKVQITVKSGAGAVRIDTR